MRARADWRDEGGEEAGSWAGQRRGGRAAPNYSYTRTPGREYSYGRTEGAALARCCNLGVAVRCHW